MEKRPVSWLNEVSERSNMEYAPIGFSQKKPYLIALTLIGSL